MTDKISYGIDSTLALPPQRIEHRPIQVNNYKIRLNDDIVEPSSYNEEFNIIESMSENDQCTLMINTCGGDLSTVLEFYSAIDETLGHVHGHISGEAHSAGGAIFLKCHSYSVSKHAHMLIHNGSGGQGGKMSDVFSKGEHDRKWFSNFLYDAYRDFLTDEEIQDVLKGVDIWLDSEQIGERLEIMCQARDARAAEEYDKDQQEESKGKLTIDITDEPFVIDTPLSRGDIGLDKELLEKLKHKHYVEDEPSTIPFEVLVEPPEDTLLDIAKANAEDSSDRAKVGVKYDWESDVDEMPSNLRKGDKVRVYFRDGDSIIDESPEGWSWSHDMKGGAIVAYELITPVEDTSEGCE